MQIVYIKMKKKLGNNFNLCTFIIFDFVSAMSAYHKYYNDSEINHWKDANFLYGLGLVYFHFNSYQW